MMHLFLCGVRKVIDMSQWKEGHRRSPRISALDACKALQSRRVASTAAASDTIRSTAQEMQVHHSRSQPKEPTSRTRTRKKRKLRPLEDVAAYSFAQLQQGGEEQSHEDHPNNTSQSSSVPSTSWMPEKCILELILDILQRRDTYEIFAEPVDPAEVADYYQIIKEPMDFGTMRAKLHEGMYSSLEQFEHDVFLICRNAMHFNSSATIYFRQARAIHELAKRVFHVLKMDPENFELQFSETRRRSGRRPHNEATRGSLSNSSLKCNNVTMNQLPKIMPYSLGGSSNLIKVARDGGRTSSSEADRRSTYRPSTAFLNENHSIVSTVYNDSKILMHVNLENIGYERSLMFFVKDLGPTAQMIAKRKLCRWPASAPHSLTACSNFGFQGQKCESPTTSFSAQLRPSTPGTAAIIPTSHNLLNQLHGHHYVNGSTTVKMGQCDSDRGEKDYTGERTRICGSSAEVAQSGDGKTIPVGLTGKVHPTVVMNTVTNNIQNESIGIQLDSYSSFSGSRDFKFSY